LVKYAAAVSPLPFFAIGGIDVSNVAAVAGAGARGVAVVRAIAGADNPEAAAQALAGALKDYERGSTGYTATAA
jgi:thiamine-phosphate pyrophosphorylase